MIRQRMLGWQSLIHSSIPGACVLSETLPKIPKAVAAPEYTIPMSPPHITTRPSYQYARPLNPSSNPTFALHPKPRRRRHLELPAQVFIPRCAFRHRADDGVTLVRNISFIAAQQLAANSKLSPSPPVLPYTQAGLSLCPPNQIAGNPAECTPSSSGQYEPPPPRQPHPCPPPPSPPLRPPPPPPRPCDTKKCFF